MKEKDAKGKKDLNEKREDKHIHQYAYIHKCVQKCKKNCKKAHHLFLVVSCGFEEVSCSITRF